MCRRHSPYRARSSALADGGIGLTPFDVGDAGRLGARLRFGQHRPGYVESRDAAGATDGPRDVRRRRAAAAADVQHPLARARRR